MWAELLALALEAKVGDDRLECIQAQVDASFSEWLASRYAGLANLPPVPPVMLHHIPRLLARELREGDDGKVALLVVDGLALDQWVVLRRELSKQRPNLRLREDAVFAWIPTVTSVSRQAIFAGRPPLYFPNSIQTTDREPILWRQFWESEGIDARQVAYCKGLAKALWILSPNSSSARTPAQWAWWSIPWTRSCTAWRLAQRGCTTKCANGRIAETWQCCSICFCITASRSSSPPTTATSKPKAVGARRGRHRRRAWRARSHLSGRDLAPSHGRTSSVGLAVAVDRLAGRFPGIVGTQPLSLCAQR